MICPSRKKRNPHGARFCSSGGYEFDSTDVNHIESINPLEHKFAPDVTPVSPQETNDQIVPPSVPSPKFRRKMRREIQYSVIVCCLIMLVSLLFLPVFKVSASPHSLDYQQAQQGVASFTLTGFSALMSSLIPLDDSHLPGDSNYIFLIICPLITLICALFTTTKTRWIIGMICGAIQAALVVSSIVFIQFMARIVVAEGSSVQVAVGLGAVLTALAALALIVLCVFALFGIFRPRHSVSHE